MSFVLEILSKLYIVRHCVCNRVLVGRVSGCPADDSLQEKTNIFSFNNCFHHYFVFA